MSIPDSRLPSEPAGRSRSLVSMFLTTLFLVVTGCGLLLLTLGFAPFVPVIILGIVGITAFHYLVWGWWLGAAIRRQVEAEEHQVIDTAWWADSDPAGR